MVVSAVELTRGMLSGEKNSLAQLISLAERDASSVPEIMKMITPHLGKAYCIGITGSAGVGKSTLVDRLTSVVRSNGLSVGIVAVDVSSAISGGAILGDRIRMPQHFLDNRVFIRSMATRGSYGGLSESVSTVVNLLDAFGKDIIIVETVGVGQTQVDIQQVADTIVVVVTPEAGDSIQFMKAGLIEIASIIAVNKADREEANQVVSEIRNVLMLSQRSGWQVPVVTTQAINDIGIKELYQEIEKHQRFLNQQRDKPSESFGGS